MKVPGRDDRPYGDPDVGWYFKAYLDSGDGMGTLTSPIVRGKDAPSNAVLLDETIADYTGKPTTIPARWPYSNAMPGLSISTGDGQTQRQHRTPGTGGTLDQHRRQLRLYL